MGQNYVEEKIREAVQHAGGNAALAKQQIIAWAMEDMRLLLGLTRSHLSGIVAYNIERVVSGRADKQRQQGEPAPPVPDIPEEEGNFGMEILKAVAGNNGAQFGFEPSTIRKHQKVSQSHVDALRMMASKKSSSRE